MEIAVRERIESFKTRASWYRVDQEISLFARFFSFRAWHVNLDDPRSLLLHRDAFLHRSPSFMCVYTTRLCVRLTMGSLMMLLLLLLLQSRARDKVPRSESCNARWMTCDAHTWRLRWHNENRASVVSASRLSVVSPYFSGRARESTKLQSLHWCIGQGARERDWSNLSKFAARFV